MSDSCKKRYILVPDGNLTKGEKGDKGDPGQDALSVLPISTDDVLYGTEVLTDVLDELLYLPLSISSFVATQTIFEKGQVLTSLGFTWSYNKTILDGNQSITGTGVIPPTLLLTDRNATVTLSNISINTIVTLTADDISADAKPAKLATISLEFLDKIYYGKAIYPGAINSAFVLGLQFSNLQADNNRDFTVNTGANEYIWFAAPVLNGVVSFEANGFDDGFQLESTFSFTNASGYVSSYNLYRSVNSNLGLTNVTTH
jgi:hypothetical protein